MESNQPTHEKFNTIFKKAGNYFENQKLYISLFEYLELLDKNPAPHLKTAHQVVRDVLWKDAYKAPGIGKKERNRSKIFDTGPDPIRGHNEAIHKLMDYLNHNTDRGTQRGKVILLVGPNRTGKSMIVDHIIRALREYYANPENGFFGRIVFSFLSEEKRIGFGMKEKIPSDTDKPVASRFTCTAGCHPLWLFPDEQRKGLLDTWLENENWEYSNENLPPIYSYIVNGHLCSNCETILRALIWRLKREHPDMTPEKLMEKVYSHIDLQRINFNHLSENGVVLTSITEGFNIKANLLQSQIMLPPFLAGEQLMIHTGHFVGAQAGLVARDEFFKRDLGRIEADLMALDSGHAGTGAETVQINLCMIGTDNFATFIGVLQQMGANAALILSRSAIINVMNLIKASDERLLHEESIRKVEKKGFHFMPHSMDLLIKLVIMTRLRKIAPDHFSKLDERIKKVLTDSEREIDAYDKAGFYDTGKFSSPKYDKEELHLLNRMHDEILEEYVDQDSEGQFGMNYPEVQDLFNWVMEISREDEVTQHSITYEHIKQAFLRLLDEGIRYTFVQEFYGAVQQDLAKVFRYDYRKFPAIIEEKALFLMEEDFFEACPVLPEKNILAGFREYLDNVNAYLKGDKTYHKSGQELPVRTDLMKDFETIWGVGEADDAKQKEFRSNKIMTPLANWRLEKTSKDSALDDDALENIFPYLIDQLEKNYRELYKSKFQRIKQGMLTYLEFGEKASVLINDSELRSDTLSTYEKLVDQGYLDHEIQFMLGKLQSNL